VQAAEHCQLQLALGSLAGVMGVQPAHSWCCCSCCPLLPSLQLNPQVVMLLLLLHLVLLPCASRISGQHCEWHTWPTSPVCAVRGWVAWWYA
jgi:hypothetical protein